MAALRIHDSASGRVHMAMATLVRFVGILLVAFATGNAWAVIEIDGLGDIDLGTWAPASGSISDSEDFCVAARRGNSSNPGPYAVMVSPLVGTQFELVSVADPGVTIPVSLSFQDIRSGLSVVLTPSVFSSREMTGVANCIGTNNARIGLTIAAGDLALAPPGDYQASFRLTGQGTANRTLSQDFTLTLRTLPVIQISGLDPIDLGIYDGVSDLQGGDDFCVFSNSATGAYTVTASGQGSNGSFAVLGGVAGIPLSVEYDDGSGFVPMVANTPSVQANADDGGIDCTGASSARIRVRALSADMQAADGGIYSGELTLLVAPI